MKSIYSSIRLVSVLGLLVPRLALAQVDVASPQPGDANGDESATGNSTQGDASRDSASEPSEGADVRKPKDGKGPAATAKPPITPEAQGTDNGPTQKESTASVSAVGVQRVPGTGYPGAPTDDSRGVLDSLYGWNWQLGNTRPKVRGIYGGSLWLTFHGLQWPYMPQQPGEPAFMLGLGGSGWVDSAYEKISSDGPNGGKQKYLRQQGRFVLRATPTYRQGNWFIQGQAELVASNDQSNSSVRPAQTDDLWVRAGAWDKFDVQLGRFEAWELYHLGMGLDLNTFERNGAAYPGSSFQPKDLYITYTYLRPDGAGNVAGHFYFTDWLRVEALTRVGNESGFNVIGERGAGILDFGWLKLKGGGEYLHGASMSETSKSRYIRRGGAGSFIFIFDPYVEFGANGALGLQDQWKDDGTQDKPGSTTQYGYGGFANVRIIGELLAGGGLNYSHWESQHIDGLGQPQVSSHTQFYGALQYGLFRQLFLKLVIASADAYFIPNLFDATQTDANNNPVPISPFHNKMLSVRLRASMYF